MNQSSDPLYFKFISFFWVPECHLENAIIPGRATLQSQGGLTGYLPGLSLEQEGAGP